MILVIFPCFYPITDDIYRFYNGLETRTWRVARELADVILAPGGSHLDNKLVISGVPCFNGRGAPYDLEKQLVLSNLDVIQKADAILDDTHFHFLHYLKEKRPDLFKNKKLVMSYDHSPDLLNTLPHFKTRIICVSKWQRNVLRNKFGNSGHQFYQAYSGLQLSLYKHLRNHKQTENNLWLYLSRFSFIKGADVVVELAKHFPQDNFIMLGDALFTQEPYFAQNLKNIADKLPNLNIIFNASWEEKIEYLNRCSGLLNPIHWNEPLGLNVLEALYFGKPVLSFPRGGPTEIIVPDIGMFANPGTDQNTDFINFQEAFKVFRKKNFSHKDCSHHVEKYFNFERLSLPIYKRVLNG